MEQQIQIAAKIYRCRTTAKRFHGDDYKARVSPYMDIINSVSKEKGIDELKAAMMLCEGDIIKDNGFAIIMIMAALAEILESKP